MLIPSLPSQIGCPAIIRRLRLLAWVGLFLFIILGGAFAPGPVLAIPIAGDYALTGPDVNGTFSSDGSKVLDNFAFTSALLGGEVFPFLSSTEQVNLPQDMDSYRCPRKRGDICEVPSQPLSIVQL